MRDEDKVRHYISDLQRFAGIAFPTSAMIIEDQQAKQTKYSLTKVLNHGFIKLSSWVCFTQLDK